MRCHEHTEHVVREHCEHEDERCQEHCSGREELYERVHEVLERRSHRRRVVTRNDEGERERDEHHHNEAPYALPTDDLERWHVHVPQDVLLNDDLPRLNELREDDEERTEELLPGRVVMVCFAFAVVVVGCDARNVHTRVTDHNERDDGDAYAEPPVARDPAAEEDDSQDRREDDHRAAEHLEDTGVDVDQTEGHQRRREEVERGRNRNDDALLPARRELLVLLLGIPHAGDEEGERHAEEHHEALHEGLIEIVLHALVAGRLEREHDLHRNGRARAEQKHHNDRDEVPFVVRCLRFGSHFDSGCSENCIGGYGTMRSMKNSKLGVNTSILGGNSNCLTEE